jgi:hypothetical protein
MPRVYEMCRAPDCSGKVTQQGEKFGLCNRHLDMLKFVLWAIDNIKMRGDKKTDSGLILP